jgi:hypothetical protein
MATLEEQLMYYHTAGDPPMKKSTIANFFRELSTQLKQAAIARWVDATAAQSRFE